MLRKPQKDRSALRGYYHGRNGMGTKWRLGFQGRYGRAGRPAGCPVHSTYQSHRAAEVIIGVDTHRDQHVSVAIDGRGVRLGERHVPTTMCGYEELERWSRGLGEIRAFGIEGTGSYGAGITRFMTGRGYTVIEVNRPDRSVRYRKGKSDPTDAEIAARSVLSGVADAIPKSGEGEVEMIRMLKSARDSAISPHFPYRPCRACCNQQRNYPM